LKSAPGRIRTADHLVRSQVLYPAELRAPARSLTLREQMGNLGVRFEAALSGDGGAQLPIQKSLKMRLRHGADFACHHFALMEQQ
jgi:hypothetical protein